MKRLSESSLLVGACARFRFVPAMLLVALLAGRSPAVAAASGVSKSAVAAVGDLPISFEANLGQAAGDARFMARGPNYYFSISPTSVRVSLRKTDRPPAHPASGKSAGSTPAATTFRSVQMEFLGANPGAVVSGENELLGRVNYLLGRDPANWHTGVPTYARVRVRGIYPGIDLVHYGNPQQLEFDFEVAVGADPSVITMHCLGADRVRLNAQGDLILGLGAEEVRQPKPTIYQWVRGARKEIAGGYRLTDARTVTFAIGAYDRSLPLVIDPVLEYSTFYGGSGVDAAWGVVVDASGFVYLAGETMAGLPVTTGTLTNRYSGAGAAGHGDAFVAKFDNQALQVIYRTYIGGSLDDAALSLAVDTGGNAYITGYTDSPDFPTQSALFPTISGVPYPAIGYYPLDGFVTKLGPFGTNLVYSTYLGGDSVDEGVGIAVDPSGNAYVAGFTQSANFPTANVTGRFAQFNGDFQGNDDAFVTKFGPAGTNLIYSMFLGGSSVERGNDVAADASGLAYVTGYTSSTNFPVTANASQPWLAGAEDAFVTVVSPTGDQLVSSTYLGGRKSNYGYRLTLDAANKVYVTGATFNDPEFPTSPGAVNSGGIFRSTDAGLNWSASSAGLPAATIYSLTMDPGNPARMYAGTARGIARSADGGSTWDPAIQVAPADEFSGMAPGIAVGAVYSVAVNPAAPLIVYAGTDQGVFKSLDGGVNWALSSVNLFYSARTTVMLNPLTPDLVFAGNGFGVYRSTNAAANWTQVNTGLGNISVNALAILAGSTTTLYAGTGAGIYRSLNNGDNWFPTIAGLAGQAVQAIAIDPVTPTTLYVGTPGGVFKSLDAATNWSRFSTGLVALNITALAIDPQNPATLYAGSTNGLFKSTDAALTWNLVTNGPAAPSVLTVLVSPQSPATVYAGSQGTNFFGLNDAFVTKLGPGGYSVVLGGALDDQGWDVAVDAAGHAHVVGSTSSLNFPTANTLGVLSAVNSGFTDVFLAELSADGRTLLNSAYLGGLLYDYGYAIAVDSVGDVYLAGQTSSANFPTRAALQGSFAGYQDAFLAKIISTNLPLPTLQVQSDGDQVRLSWPILAADYKLQSTTNVTTTNGWQYVPVAPVPTNLTLNVTLPATNDAQFFRLTSP